MIHSMLSTALVAPHTVFALASNHNDAPYSVILGLAIIAALEIGAGFLMIRSGDSRHRHR